MLQYTRQGNNLDEADRAREAGIVGGLKVESFWLVVIAQPAMTSQP